MYNFILFLVIKFNEFLVFSSLEIFNKKYEYTLTYVQFTLRISIETDA